MSSRDMLTLPTPDRDRLVKVLGLTTSDHPGEVVAAVVAARRILTKNGLEWRDVIVSPQTAPHRQRRPAEDKTTAQDAIAWCLDHGTLITDWERKFLVSLQSFTRHSAKQKIVQERIVRKCQDIQR